jgi:hypothetical protein
VNDVMIGAVSLDAIEPAALPPALAAIPQAERELFLRRAGADRERLRGEIAELARRRDEFIEAKLAEDGGAASSLDVQLYEAVREQGASKGLRYEGGPRF